MVSLERKKQENLALNYCHRYRLPIIIPTKKDLEVAYYKLKGDEKLVKAMYVCQFPGGFNGHMITAHFPLQKDLEPPEVIKCPIHHESEKIVSLIMFPQSGSENDFEMLYLEK